MNNNFSGKLNNKFSDVKPGDTLYIFYNKDIKYYIEPCKVLQNAPYSWETIAYDDEETNKFNEYRIEIEFKGNHYSRTYDDKGDTLSIFITDQLANLFLTEDDAKKYCKEFCENYIRIIDKEIEQKTILKQNLINTIKEHGV